MVSLYLFGWLAGWSFGCLVVWLFGWFVGCWDGQLLGLDSAHHEGYFCVVDMVGG